MDNMIFLLLVNQRPQINVNNNGVSSTYINFHNICLNYDLDMLLTWQCLVVVHCKIFVRNSNKASEVSGDLLHFSLWWNTQCFFSVTNTFVALAILVVLTRFTYLINQRSEVISSENRLSTGLR